MEIEKKQQTPEQDALEHIVACRDKPFLEERLIDSVKGRGVFTQQTIEPSTFVVEYRGKISSLKNRRSRRKREDTLNNYLYAFSWKGASWCIDASKEDETLGRLVNDDHINPNCEMKKVEFEGTPHLCLFALKEISLGEEITYNYGDSSYSWRSRLLAGSYSDDEELLIVPKSKRGSDGNYKPAQTDLSSDEHCSDGDYKPEEAASSSDEHGADSDSLDNKNTEEPKAMHESRRNYCYVCGKGMMKIARHLLRHADEEPDIANALALPKKSKERKTLLNDLRNRGNYKHNKKVLKTKCGVLKAKRQPKTRAVNHETHVHCLYCKGLFSRSVVRRHLANCSKKTSNPATCGKTNVMQEPDLAQSPVTKKPLSDMQQIILSMPKDETTFMVKHDPLLIQLTQYLSEKYAGCQEHENIKQTLRQMGKFLLALHGQSIFSFEDALKPENFSKVVEAVKGIAGFHEKKQRYKKPSLAVTLGQALKEIANIVVSKPDGNEETVRDTKTFITLCEEEWKGLKSDKEDALLRAQKVKSPSTISFTHDVQALYSCLETTTASAIETMKKYESPQVYNALCRVIEAQVFILNKGAREVLKMTLESFQKRDDSAQVLSKHFVRINIPSTTGRNVALLLTSELIGAITLLVSKRMSCGVHKDNGFLFAKADGSPSSFQAGRPCTKVFTMLCHAKNPEFLTSAYYQKHIARVFQILNLENDELEHLAKLLGRDICTEKSYYRLPEAAVELAKIAKLLLAMEKGSLERCNGNSLNEIEIEDQLEPDVEKDSMMNNDGEEKCGLFPQWKDAGKSDDSRLTPEQDALKHIEACEDKPFLEGIFIDHFKGRGVFTCESIEPSTFVVEYRGNICSQTVQENKVGDTLNNYLFDFSWNGTNWCIDASTDDGTLGRLVNDEHKSPNCEMRKVVYEGKPHLCLFALKKIFAGEEITYNYGDSSCPWRSTESSEKQKTKNTTSFPGKEKVDDSSSAESCCEGPDDDPRSDDDFTSNNQDDLNEDSVAAKSQFSTEQSIHDSSVHSERDAHAISYTRKNYCYICGKAQTKLARHLFTHRKKDAEIAAVFALPRLSKERKLRLGQLRNKGNWKHNREVLKAHCGELKIRRRPSNVATSGKTLAICIYCKIMCDRTEMWQHLKKCPSRLLSSPATSNKVLSWVASTVFDPQEMSPTVNQMTKTMRGDVTGSLVLTDSYMLLLAEYWCHNKKIKANTFDYVRSKLRQMGRLLLLLRMRSVCSFEDAMKPQNFSKVVEAVGEFTGSSAEACDRVKVTTTALVKSLHIMGNIKYVRALKDDAGEKTVEEAEAFMALCAKQWDTLPSTAFNTHDAKTTKAIPFTQDVQLLYQFMEKTADSGVKSLPMYETPQVYNALSRVTLAQVSVLNRNVQDISTVTLQAFSERQDSELHADATGCQSQFEQILCKRFVKIHVKSRRGKKVSVTLTPGTLSAITLLANKREACGVHKRNSYLFARPGATPSSFYRGKTCIATLVSWSGAKNTSHLKSRFFRKHVARIFQILSLSDDELDQLSKLLGRDICTDRGYYQKPEAAVDIAKILQLISAMEKGSMEELEGKSLDEVELEDELEPDMEQSSPESSDNEDDDTEAQSCPQTSDIANKTSITEEQATTSKDRGERQESGDEDSEPSGEKDDGTEDQPVKCAEETPCLKGDASNVWFSDDDEDMNVDLDFDIDTDEDVRNAENDGGGHSTATVTDQTGTLNQSSENGSSPVDSPDTDDHMDKKDQETGLDQTDWMDVENSSDVLNPVVEKKDKLSAAVTGRKELKIFIPKLEIANVADPIHISQLSSLYKKRPMKDQLILHHSKKCKASTSTDMKKPDDAKDIEMTCSHCKSSMTKGQTAFQKKGFTDVFCSKFCLFEMFPMNKPATKTCHYCLKVVTQLLDVIMAVVDTKGTIKDFCCVLCLTSFKSNTTSTVKTQPLCSMCNKLCTITRELNINEAVHRFCSSSCLEGFRQNCIAACKNCNAPCLKKVQLKLGEDIKPMCSQRCVGEFKENIKTPHPCSRCHTPVPMSSMTVFKSSEDTVELFCSLPCATSEERSHVAFSKICYNCFEMINRPQSVILAPVDDSGIMRELCSETCLASVKSKRSMALTSQTPRPVGPRSECRMCVRYGHCKFKVTLEGVAYNLCSDSCLVNYYKVNNLPLLTCDLCCSFNFEKRLVLNVEDGSKNICSEKCLVKFKEKVQTPQLCRTCQTLHQMSDMVENDDGSSCLNFFCSNRCMMVYKAPCITAPESKPEPQENKEVKPSLPHFDCSKVKEEPDDDEYKLDALPSLPTQDIKDEPTVAKIDPALAVKGEPTPAASCSSCKEVLMNRETVYQRKGQSEMFCSTSCLFKSHPMKPVQKTCHFCLEVITQHQDVTQAQLDGEGTVKDFCSQACLSSFNYKTFVSTKIPIVSVRSHSQCDVCGRYCISKHEVLQQDVVHKMCSDPCFRRFCNMSKVSVCANCQSQCNTCLTLKLDDGSRALCSAECLSQFKRNVRTQQPCATCRASVAVAGMFENQTNDHTVELFCSSSCVRASKAQSASAAAKPSPVITSVMSLASALAKHLRASSSARQASLPDVQNKVVGHAFVQTAPKEVKNKSLLCTPLVHNKGVCCTTQTVDTEAQTDNFTPTVVVLPLPVPVYVPLPMNMYTQYAPQPVGLPLPLPVPMFLPVAPTGSEPTVTTTEEKIQPEASGEKLKPEKEPEQNDGNEGDDGQKNQGVTKQGQHTQTRTDQPSSCHNVTKDNLDTSNIQEGSSSDTLPELPPASPQSSQSPASLEKVHNKNEVEEEDTAPKRASRKHQKHQKHHRLKCHRGIDAWKRWVQWRESQSAASRGSEGVVTLKENILDCSASELNDCLCCFISEVKRPDGERYSTSSLFYLCLAIQLYLFENRRMENIFSDWTYNKFSTKFTEILKPSVTVSGYIQSRVEEEYLWECKQLGAYSPIVLLNTLLFFCCKYFGLTTVEQHRQLSFAHVTRCTKTKKDNTKTTFLLFKAPVTKNETESETDGVPVKKRKRNETEVRKLMMENPENPLRCPVRLYEFYLSKCVESVRKRSDLFYLHPDRSCAPSSPLWFSCTPLDRSMMEAMLVQILNVREVQSRHRRALGQQQT